MLKAQANSGSTILDYLNEDCWRHVLQFVPTRDVMRTERASKRWRAVVLSYLQGVHVSIKDNSRSGEESTPENTGYNTYTLEPSKYKSFVLWTNKLGSTVVTAYCNNWEDLEIIRKTCPNLKSLKLINIDDCKAGLHNLNDDFECLKQLSFRSCPITDLCVSQFIADKALEALKFSSCQNVSGQCLSVINTSMLKTLVFNWCSRYGLESKHIAAAVERLSELTELKLTYVTFDVTLGIQSILDKMRKLEQLEIYSDVRSYNETMEPLTRLTRLKHLKVDLPLCDSDVELLMSHCRELRSLHLLDCCAMTSGCAGALARHGRLSTLSLHGFYELDDDGVAALVRGCPQLTSMDISGASFLTPRLPRRAEAQWRAARPGLGLTLDLSSTCLENDEILDNYEGEEYEEMKRLFDELNTKYKNMVLVFET